MSQTAHPPYVEAVTVSVGYGDFLDAVAPFNSPLFDRWVVVTDHEDAATREVCRKYGLYCLPSSEGRDGGDFAKGRMIERGLQHTSARGWRVHVDADVALPNHFRHALRHAGLQEDSIYGVDRLMVRSWDDWVKLRATNYLNGGQHGYGHAVHFPQGFYLGSRWAGADTGYVPIGYFQMWHSSQDEWRGIRVKPYPVTHGNACRTDVQHGLQWDRGKRLILPEVVAVHLESEQCAKGTNWGGRRTKRFGPGPSGPPAEMTYATPRVPSEGLS